MEILAEPYINHYQIVSSDLKKPWGQYYRVADSDVDKFIAEYFPNIKIETHLPISPKILIIKPNVRLSWQYHSRRKEVWSVLKGPVGYVCSYDDIETEMQIAENEYIMIVDREERHRLVGLDTYAVVAELWCHTDKSNLSDEADIVRVQDDFQR